MIWPQSVECLRENWGLRQCRNLGFGCFHEIYLWLVDLDLVLFDGKPSFYTGLPLVMVMPGAGSFRKS